MRKKDLTAGERLGWAAAGFGAGLLAGIVVGQWLGAISRARLQQVYSRLREPGVDPLKPAAAVRAAREALAKDDILRALRLEPVSVRPGVVQLHGWVADRQIRARAARVVAAVPGIESLVNGILVHGEDDDQIPTTRSAAADQSA